MYGVWQRRYKILLLCLRDWFVTKSAEHSIFLPSVVIEGSRYWVAPRRTASLERELEAVRRRYGFVVAGYVLMPEHVHLLVSEPSIALLATAIKVLKQRTSRKLKSAGEAQFWQRRYYDFNVGTEEKTEEKLQYMHRNPVNRGLVAKPEDWEWSSFRHYATGLEGLVEIESEWTARRRETPAAEVRGLPPFAKYAKDGAPIVYSGIHFAVCRFGVRLFGLLRLPWRNSTLAARRDVVKADEIDLVALAVFCHFEQVEEAREA